MLNSSNKLRFRPLAGVLLLAALLSACGSSNNDNDQAAIEIKVLSNRADLVSNGDALTEIILPSDVDRDSLRVTLNGADITSGFVRRDDGRLLGLVSGLEAGANTIEADASGARTARIGVTNTPRGGPVYSGPQASPFFCATVTSRPATETTPETITSGFGTEALDATCNIETEYRFYYKTTAAGCSLNVPNPGSSATPAPNLCFQPYDPAAPAPADLATTTTDAGVTVPYIVRVERGTMNRGIYDIAVLVDPVNPWGSGVEPQGTWNGKVNFLFGGAGGQIYKQMLPASRWTEDMALSRGWLVAVNTMLDSSRNNNRVVTAETVMMMKEHIIDRYGEVRYTVATGCSAGSINAYSVASLHPGLLDGALISCSLLDYDTSHIINYECGLLTEAYNSPAWKAEMVNAGYTQEQINLKRAAIERNKDHTVCQSWYNSFGQQRWNGNNTVVNSIPSANADTGEVVTSPIDPPTNNCNLPPALVWDPVSNPNGVRCGPWDWAASVYGKTPDGVGRSTRDNVGVQYGLVALREGKMTPEEFVLLNESVGGLSPEGALTPGRTAASLDVLEIVYRNGLIVGPGLDSMAIIDMRGDDNLHPYWRSWGVRERLVKENGHHDNQVIWQYVGTSTPSNAMRLEALMEMDKWLAVVEADTNDAPLAQKVAAARPATTFDYCLLSSNDPTQASKVTDTAACRAEPALKILGSPRQGAGGPVAEDVMKCQLKPLDPADYAPAVLSAAQLGRLQAVFPDGVCDWSKPGVGKQPKADGPLTYVNGPGGEPLPPAPTSESVR